MMALNRYRLKHLQNQHHRGASRAARLLQRPDRLIGLILIGNNLVNILASAIATVIAIRLWGDAGIIIATISLTLVILVFAEITPKTIAALHPEAIAFPASLVLLPLLKLLYTSIRDLINAFVGDKKRFDRPVAVAFTESARALGFVTRETLHGLHLPGHVAVYFPQSYNFAGNLLIVPKELVEPLDVHPTDMMAFIVSGGVSGLGIGSHGESMPPSMPPDRPTDQKTLIGHQGPGER